MANSVFGNSVALSSNGSVALVGGEGTAALIGGPPAVPGVADIFSGSRYSKETDLGSSSERAGTLFGLGVALSGDGTMALVGAPRPLSTPGAPYLFSGPGYATQTTLQAKAAQAADGFGRSVALSSDGTTALVGANFANNQEGAAFVLTGTGYSTHIACRSLKTEPEMDRPPVGTARRCHSTRRISTPCPMPAQAGGPRLPRP